MSWSNVCCGVSFLQKQALTGFIQKSCSKCLLKNFHKGLQVYLKRLYSRCFTEKFSDKFFTKNCMTGTSKNSKTVFFLEHQQMSLNRWRRNRREWVVETEYCWCWITKHNKEYCSTNFKKVSKVKKNVFTMPMLMRKSRNGLATASYLFFSP